MKEHFKNPLLLWLMIPAVLSAYAVIASAYPYYAKWDSSMLCTLDAFLVGAGLVPDHLFLPNMVPVVLFRYVWLPIGVLFGWISASSIDQLEASANPYLPFVETTAYLILVGYVYALVFLTFMYLSFFRLFEPQLATTRGRLAAFLVISLTALALVWEHLPFMLYWVRYETVGIALWSVALYLTICAASKPTNRRWIVLAGFFAGAAVMSKIQLAGGAALLPFLYVFLLRESPPRLGSAERWICVALATGVAALLAVIHYLAYSAFTNDELPRVAFDTVVRPTMRFVPISPAFAGALAVTVLVVTKSAERHPIVAALAARGVFFSVAFCSVLLLGLSIGTTWSDRLGVLYWTYIYSFNFGQLAFGEATGYLKPIPWGQHSVLFVFCAAAIAAIALGWVRARERMPRGKLIAGVATVVTAVVAIVTLTRPGELPKDGMLISAWTTFVLVMVWRLLLELYEDRKVLLLGCTVSCLWVGWQIASLSSFHETHYRADFHAYNTKRWRVSTYGFRGDRYEKLMRRSYANTAAWRRALRWSLDIAGTKLLLTQVFRNREVRLVDTMLAFKGSRLGVGDAEEIKRISRPLDGALLVPLEPGRAVLGIRADHDFYCISSGSSRVVSGKHRAMEKLQFGAARGGEAIETYSVHKLVHGEVVLDVGAGTTMIAIQRNLQ